MSSTAQLAREDQDTVRDTEHDTVRAPRQRSGRSLLLTVVSCVVALGVVALLLSALWWRSVDGRWFMVETPSMGTAMPVGTLVLTEPVAIGDVEVGDVITFHAPQSGTVYTHRVVDSTPQGLTTQGDVNDVPDPGTLTQENLIGTVAWHVPALGWVLKAVPFLLIGTAVGWLLSLLVAAPRRRGVRLLGLSLSVSVANVVLHPWVGLEKMSQRAPEDGKPGVLLDLISTGLLPVRAEQVGGGASVALRDGEVATMHLAPRSNGAYDVFSTLHLSWWGWVALVAVCLAPLVLSLVVGPGRSEVTSPVAVSVPVDEPVHEAPQDATLDAAPEEGSLHLPRQATDTSPRTIRAEHAVGRRFRPVDEPAGTRAGSHEDHLSEHLR